MTVNMMNTETICDLQGQPVDPRSVTLLKALDKMLTVGSYYSIEHEQYQQASAQSCRKIVGVIAGHGNKITLEITAQGLMVGSQNIDPSHRNVRLLHELLVPLNIARLDIHGSLTPGALRQAIAVLQEHKMDLGQSSTFHEINFDNLPASVKAVSCSVLQKSEDQADGGAVSLNDLLGSWDEQDFSQMKHDSMSVTEKLAGQFMDMVTRILENIEKLKGVAGGENQDKNDSSYATREDLTNLKQALQRLVDVNPDPEELTKLITQAQRALHLSQDAESVNLAFQILKKDMAKKDASKAPQKPKKFPKIEFKLTVDELLEAVSELEKIPASLEDPWDAARTDQLVISLLLLRSDPPQALREGMIHSIESIMDRPDFCDKNLGVCAQIFHIIAQDDGPEVLDKVLPLIMGLLRSKRSDMIAPFWAHLTEIDDDEHMTLFWPHLVNDILLGFEGSPPKLVKKLVLFAGKIPLHAARDLDSQLQQQPALQKKTAARDLFIAPLSTLYPVHAMLMATPLRDWLTAELYRSMRAKPGTPLVEVVMEALGEHQSQYATFYLDLIRHQDGEQPPAEVRELAVEILQGVLSGASPEERSASWVPLGLLELGKLDPESAKPLLNRVISERKYLFFKAWPEPVRKAAANTLKILSKGGV